MEQQDQPVSPPTPPAIPQQSQSLSSVNVNKLGVFLDGWADLVEGKGAKATEVKQNVYKFLLERNMPDIVVAEVNGSVGIGSSKRPYNIAATHPSATTAIYVGEHGQDMYVSWRTFIKPQLSNAVIALGIISLLLGLLAGFGVISFPFRLFGQSIVSSFTVMLFTLVSSLVTALFIFGFFSFVLGVLGVVFKGDFRAFFFVEPNIFDAEDITAMGLSAHKSIIRSLDSTGDIDITQLRLKQNFKGGRSAETV
jgi:hypothetical protein